MLFANRAARDVIGIGPDDPLPRVDLYEFFDTTPEQLAEMRQSIIDHGRWSGELDLLGVDLRDSGVGRGHRAPQRVRPLRVFLGVVARHHRTPHDRCGPPAERGRAAVDRAVVAARDLRRRRRRHRARVEPRVARNCSGGPRPKRSARSRRSSPRPRRSTPDRAGVRGRDGSRRTKRATSGKDGRPDRRQRRDRAVAQRRPGASSLRSSCSPTSATRSEQSSRCARARSDSARSCRTRATW